MRHVMTSLLIASCASSAALAFQAGSGATAARNVCQMLTKDLVMKVSTPAGRAVLERAKPDANWAGPGVSTCMYGRVALVLNPFKQPDQVRSALRTRTAPYKDYEPVSGVGDAAFFRADTAYANLYVWTGAQQFHIQMAAGFDDDAEALKPNTVALAHAIIPKLR